MEATAQPAFRLNVEAAKPHKWHLSGTGGVWTGVGHSPSALVTWVPQHKAAKALVGIVIVLEGRMEVISYRSLYHTLQDLMHATGGGWYRMHGMSVPLRDDAELGEGHGTIVKLRAQMKQRLLAWAKVLANCPGAPMVALQRVSRPQWGGVVWEIGGDAAREAGEPKVGL